MRAPTIEQAEHAEKVLAFIEAHPEQHDQNQWIGMGDSETTWSFIASHSMDRRSVDPTPIPIGCGTVGCFAGWTAALDKAEMYYVAGPQDYGVVGGTGHVIVKQDGFDVPLQDWAANRLGLEPYRPDWRPRSADHPFDTDVEMEELREWVRCIRFAAEEEVTVRQVYLRRKQSREAGQRLD